MTWSGALSMTYREDWTSDRLPHWLPIIGPALAPENLRALEIGVYEGRSTVWMLEHILTHPTSRIVCLDPFEPNAGMVWTQRPHEYHDAFLENTAPYREQIAVVRAYSQNVDAATLAAYAPNGYDLVYIDASHDAAATVREAQLAWDVAKPGAFVIFDDYGGTLKERVSAWLPGHCDIVDEGYQLISRAVK